MERPTKERLAVIREELEVTQSLSFEFDVVGELFAEIDALRHELALSQHRERDALRRGFNGALALDEGFRVKHPKFEDLEKHLAEGAEHAATLARIAEAEEGEEWPQDT
jgi:hypothetical protein